MNAAEITDKLGLHSLRQRAWVCLCVSSRQAGANLQSTVHPICLRNQRRRALRGPQLAQRALEEARHGLRKGAKMMEQKMLCLAFFFVPCIAVMLTTIHPHHLPPLSPPSLFFFFFPFLLVLYICPGSSLVFFFFFFFFSLPPPESFVCWLNT